MLGYTSTIFKGNCSFLNTFVSFHAEDSYHKLNLIILIFKTEDCVFAEFKHIHQPFQSRELALKVGA